MNTTYQFDDGKIIVIERKDGNILVNIVHDDEEIAKKVCDRFLMMGLTQDRLGQE